MKTFKCAFGPGITCKIQVTDTAPPKGESHIRLVEWTGTPSMLVLRPYVNWMHSVNQQLANEWGIKLMHIFLVSRTGIEVWGYEPGKEPKLLES